MVELRSVQSAMGDLLNRRSLRPLYAAFTLALLLLASIPLLNDLVRVPLALLLFGILLLAAPLTGMLIGCSVTARAHALILPLLLVDAAAALGLIALTGGYTSPLWVALLIVSSAAPLLLPGRWAALLLVAVWFADGLFLLQAPPDMRLGVFLTWALRLFGVALVALGLRRALATEEGLRLRAQRREQVLHDFLLLSNRLRVTSEPQMILEEVARAVQGSGDFDCVTLSRVDWHAALVTVAVAIGASGRRLTAVEELSFAWSSVAPLLSESQRDGPATYRVAVLPFRHIKNEQHLLLPLHSQFGEVQGLLTVSYNTRDQATLAESLPLLELLANQAAAALDNSALFGTLEQRVKDATATLTHSQDELAIARDRAETLYQIVRTLSNSLDEREVLVQALTLVARATDAERSGIMLVEPNSGRLAFRTTHDKHQQGPSGSLEQGQQLAGWVLANRTLARIPDVRRDSRWWAHAQPDERIQSVLAVPLLLDDEALGVLLLTHSQLDHFRAEHGQLALAAAGQIAVALSKAQLYRYVSEQSERLGLTLQQREEEIRKSQAILQSIGDGVVVSDRLGRIRLLNPAAERMLGVKAERFIGRLLADLAGAPETLEGGMEQIKMGERTLRAHAAPVLSSTSESLGKVVVYHDITSEALTDRLKSEFIATASHELRTPLTSIRGYVDLLMMDAFGALSEPQREFLKIIKNNVERLVELIDDLLDISKAEAGEVRLRRETVDVAEVVHEVCAVLYTQFTQREISLAINTPPASTTVIADRQRVRQIILNLINNACKYTPDGGHVDVALHNGGDEVRVEVRDTGVGIAEAAQPFIFTRFFRADNSRRDTVGGTGLGLSITKTLIELHGGRIWFDSREGQGSTFSFALPIANQDWTPAEWLNHT